MVADTRASITQKGYIGANGDTTLCNDDTVKYRTFDPGFMWDDQRDIRLIGCSGTITGIRKFCNFMKTLQCPMEQFLLTMNGLGKERLFNLIGLEKPSSFILCLDNGQSIKLNINSHNYTYAGPDNKVKAIGSGAFYFEALKDVFHIEPEVLFRIAINVDAYSSKDAFIEATYDAEKKSWGFESTVLSYSNPLDPEALINGMAPGLKAILKGAIDALEQNIPESPPLDYEVEDVPVKIPKAKKQ